VLFDIVKAIAAKGGRIRLVPCFAATMAQISVPDCSTLQHNCSMKIFQRIPLAGMLFCQFCSMQHAAWETLQAIAARTVRRTRLSALLSRHICRFRQYPTLS